MTLRALILCCLAFQCVAAPRVDDAALSGRDATEWPGYGRAFDQQRFSPLAEINTGTVGNLGLVSSLELPQVPGLSTAPLEHAGVIYFAAGYSVVYAVEAVSGHLLWKYDPQVQGPKMRMAWGSRGLALLGDKLYVGTQDGRLLALHAATGKLAWQVQTTQRGDVRYITGAPLVFNDTVLIGQGGTDFGATRGYVTAYQAQTGRRLWRFFLVPGNPAKGFENAAMRMAAGTWTGKWWRFGGGGTVWNAMTYDPQFHRVYLGTGNGAPWNRKIRSPGGGDNLFLSCIVALDADTGHYAWHYQTTPGDTWDFDAAQDMVLARLTIDGAPREVLLQAPKNGYFYVIDRRDGRLISARNFAKVTWATGIDPVSGRPVEAAHARYENGEALLWPGTLGAHGWQPMAFSPDTGLVYLPGRDIPGYYNDQGMDPATWQMGRDGSMGVNVVASDAPVGAGRGWLVAWDPVKQAAAWRLPLPGISAGGTLATHGGLVFQANAAGEFVAYEATSGRRLWSFDMGVGGNAPPITYSIAGRQYVSVLAGWTGQAMMLGSLSAQHGWVGRTHPRRLLTFALGGSAQLPPSPAPAAATVLRADEAPAAPAQVARGQTLFNNCLMCHGLAAVAGGYAPDLRASPAVLSATTFASIVRGGALESRGMPRFAELGPSELADLRAFIRARAQEPAASPPAAQ